MRSVRRLHASGPARARRSAVTLSLVAAPLVVALIIACSDDDAAPAVDTTDACAELASRCHPYDKASALGHECHELGHAGDDNACAPRKAECLAACPPTEAGASHGIDFDASPDSAVVPEGSTEAGPDSGDMCTPWCECLTETCSTQNGYPFTSTADCVTKCPILSADEKACLPKWCEQAKTLANKTHTCEHAWGMYGTDECETLP